MANNLSLRSNRLELVAATAELLQLEGDKRQLGEVLNADVPDNWPMPLYDADARSHFLCLMRDQPKAVGWGTWYILQLDNADRRTLIGAAGAIGPPTGDGEIVIGYSILNQYQGNGYASEALKEFLAWAWSHAELRRVIADTFPELKASIRVLQKNGFRRCGDGSEPRAIRFELYKNAGQDNP